MFQRGLDLAHMGQDGEEQLSGGSKQLEFGVDVLSLTQLLEDGQKIEQLHVVQVIEPGHHRHLRGKKDFRKRHQYSLQELCGPEILSPCPWHNY